nr:organomercurial transporter MerC [Microbulbifer sp. GG15]
MKPGPLLARIGDKLGALGALVSAAGCAICFPAIASLGAAVGLGFLSRWEPLLLNTLLPLFAGLALVANALGWFWHRRWRRAALGILGPALLLLSLYPWFQYAWSSTVTYGALALMVAVAIFDLKYPPRRHCKT